jgi:hypothetical protein
MSTPPLIRFEFTGPGTPLVDHDWSDASRRLRVPEAHVRAVAQVEGAGRGFLPAWPGRSVHVGPRSPLILFERHVFHRETGGRFSADHPDLSGARWDRSFYVGGVGEWGRLERAAVLDRRAALRSCSWGAFQVMGFNHQLAGYHGVEVFARVHSNDERGHLDAWCTFLDRRGLADELRDGAWAEFARQYNGPGYARNAYDRKLAEAAGRFTEKLWRADPDEVPDERREAAMVQAALNAAGHEPPLKVDGWLGARTRGALQAFQRARGLPVTGEPDRATLAELGLGS